MVLTGNLVNRRSSLVGAVAESDCSRLDGVWRSDCGRHGVSGGPQVCASRSRRQKLHVNSLVYI